MLRLKILGTMYDQGQGVEKSYEQAFKWFEKSSIQGDTTSQLFLEFMYRYGQGVEKDKIKAFKWLTQAAEKGFAPAQYTLGRRYFEGQVVEQDYDQAVSWYKKSAKQGNYHSQFTLGRLYYKGTGGIAQNSAEAFYWFTKVVSQSSEEIKEHINFIKNSLKDLFLNQSNFLLNTPLLVDRIQTLHDGYKLIADMGLKPEQVVSFFDNLVTKISAVLPWDLMENYQDFVGIMGEIKKSVDSFKKQDKKRVVKIADKITNLLSKAAQQKKTYEEELRKIQIQKEKEELATLKKQKEQEKAIKKKEEKEKAKALKEQAQAPSMVLSQVPSTVVIDSAPDLQPLPQIPANVILENLATPSVAQTMPLVFPMQTPNISAPVSYVAGPEVTRQKKDKEVLKLEKKKRALERTVSSSFIARPSSSGEASVMKRNTNEGSSVSVSAASPSDLAMIYWTE